MIQPIRNIFSNWRNPQHKPIGFIKYPLEARDPVLIQYASDHPIVITWTLDGEPQQSTYHSSKMNLVYFYDYDRDIIVTGIYIATESATPFLAYIESGSQWVILRDER